MLQLDNHMHGKKEATFSIRCLFCFNWNVVAVSMKCGQKDNEIFFPLIILPEKNLIMKRTRHGLVESFQHFNRISKELRSKLYLKRALDLKAHRITFHARFIVMV